MEAKKSKKAAIENQRGSWLLMGVIVALSFMFVSFEWTRHDVRIAAHSFANDPIFVEELVPITLTEEKLEPPPPPETKVSEWIDIVTDQTEVTGTVSTLSEDNGAKYDVVWVKPEIETEIVVETEILVTAEIMPEFPGGVSAMMKYLSNNIKYPAMSQEVGAQGRVIIQFVVDKDGTITDPVVVKGVDAYLDKEALRVVNGMPKWKPGMQNGKKVRVKYTLPVAFRLQ